MKKTFLTLLLGFLLICCGTTKVASNDPKQRPTKEETLVNVSLLDRLRMYPGIVTRGQGQNAQVFIRGIAGVNTQKEVLFVVNGTQVGTFSRTVFSVNPVEITKIQLLKKATEIANYGFAGSGGVVQITTQQ